MGIVTGSTKSARITRSAILVAVACASSACGTFSNKEKGAVIGAATGAAVGGVVGNNTGSTTRGVLIGAVVGGAAGAVIGHQMDQQAKELMVEIPGATVVRVGEGIQVTFSSGLLYDFDSAAIRPEAATNLRNLAASLNKYENTELLIVGHTDAMGTAEYNQDLSTRRATAAAGYLATQGVLRNRMETSGKGEGEAIASNESEAGRQTNRRIEVAIYDGRAASAAPE
jgi:outer membrane protein OmpA-like peptidoglycan-associated protein